MKVVVVKFDGSPRKYEYNTNLNLIKDGKYEIIVDNQVTFGTGYITVLGYRNKAEFNGELKTITSAKCISVPAQSDDDIDMKKTLSIKEYLDGWALIKNGLEIAFYSKITDSYTFNSNGCINCATISSDDLEWFRDFLH